MIELAFLKYMSKKSLCLGHRDFLLVLLLYFSVVLILALGIKAKKMMIFFRKV